MKNENNSLLPPLWLISLLLCAGIISILVVLKELVILLILGFACSYVIEPAIKFLESRKISRLWGFFLILAVFLIFVSLLFLTTWPTLAREGQNLIENLPRYAEQAELQTLGLIQSVVGSDSAVKSLVEVPFDRLQEFGTKLLPKALAGIQNVLLSGYSITLTLINLTLLPFIVFYLTQAFPSLSVNFLNLLPRANRGHVSNIITEIDWQVAAFVRGQLLVATVLFLLFAFGLAAIGVELWLVLAVIAGFGNLIPYLGTIVGVVLCSVMAVVTFGDWWHLFAVWILFAVVQVLEGSFITPRIIGGSVGLNPLVIILAIVAFGSLFGLLGVMLAVPLAAALKVLFRHGHAWWLKKVER